MDSKDTGQRVRGHGVLPRLAAGALSVSAAFGLALGCTADTERNPAEEAAVEEELHFPSLVEWRDRHHHGHRRPHRGGSCDWTREENLTELTVETRNVRGARLRVTTKTNRSTREVTLDATVTWHGKVVFTSHSVGRDSGVETANRWFAPIRGVRRGTATSADATINASLDGRALVPIAATVDPLRPGAQFADGRPGPRIDLPPGLGHAVRELAREARDLLTDCQRPPEASTSPELAAPPMSNPGHRDEFEGFDLGCVPPGSAFCQAHVDANNRCFRCQGDCEETAVLIAFGCAVLNFFIPGAGLLCGAVDTFDYIECRRDCFDVGSACCPVDCGATPSGDGCCISGEVCINARDHLCCAASEAPCGNSCCAGGDTCCGGECCSGLCLPSPGGGNLTCCASGDACGGVCCPTMGGFVCRDPSTNLCCSVASVFCGGRCCPVGMTCDASTESCVVPPPEECAFPCVDADECIPSGFPGSRPRCIQECCVDDTG